MALTITEQQVREQLGAYLTRPLDMTSGTLSTQQTLSATSLTTGGLTGKFIIKETGSIVVYNNRGVEVVKIDQDGIIISNGTVNLVTISKDGIIVNDGTNNRVKLGDIS
jgi:hypothetical protein